MCDPELAATRGISRSYVLGRTMPRRARQWRGSIVSISIGPGRFHGAFMFVVIGAVALGLQVQVAAPPPRVPLPKPAPGAIRVSNHGNTRPAGSLNGKVLTVSLEVVTGAWRPEG